MPCEIGHRISERGAVRLQPVTNVGAAGMDQYIVAGGEQAQDHGLTQLSCADEPDNGGHLPYATFTSRREIANQVTEVRDSVLRMPLALGLSKEH